MNTEMHMNMGAGQIKDKDADKDAEIERLKRIDEDYQRAFSAYQKTEASGTFGIQSSK
jgi:hypothetical protein